MAKSWFIAVSVCLAAQLLRFVIGLVLSPPAPPSYVRSFTSVQIAYVMKHLAISLVDAYLIVRSRRLNVLIQPNMRLLYNLCGWEVELARERAKGDTMMLRRELSRSVNWPFLAREVHRLNEKYLH